MRLAYLFAVLIMIFLLNCKADKKSTETILNTEAPQKRGPILETRPLDQKSAISDRSKYKKTHQANNYSVTIERTNEDNPSVQIYTNGLSYEYDEKKSIGGRIIDSYMTDLDQDNVKEYFITIHLNDDSEQQTLIGLASNNGKSLSDIYVKPINTVIDSNTEQWFIEQESIMRKFTSDGIDQRYQYHLKKGEAGYILEGTKQ